MDFNNINQYIDKEKILLRKNSLSFIKSKCNFIYKTKSGYLNLSVFVFTKITYILILYYMGNIIFRDMIFSIK